MRFRFPDFRTNRWAAPLGRSVAPTKVVIIGLQTVALLTSAVDKSIDRHTV